MLLVHVGLDQILVGGPEGELALAVALEDATLGTLARQLIVLGELVELARVDETQRVHQVHVVHAVVEIAEPEHHIVLIQVDVVLLTVGVTAAAVVAVVVYVATAAAVVVVVCLGLFVEQKLEILACGAKVGVALLQLVRVGRKVAAHEAQARLVDAQTDGHAALVAHGQDAGGHARGDHVVHGLLVVPQLLAHVDEQVEAEHAHALHQLVLVLEVALVGQLGADELRPALLLLVPVGLEQQAGGGQVDELLEADGVHVHGVVGAQPRRERLVRTLAVHVERAAEDAQRLVLDILVLV